MEIFSSQMLGIVAALVPVVIGLVQVGRVLKIPSQFAPLVSIIAGTGLFFLLKADLSWQWTVLGGVLTGLSASGLYSGTKAVIGTQD